MTQENLENKQENIVLVKNNTKKTKREGGQKRTLPEKNYSRRQNRKEETSIIKTKENLVKNDKVKTDKNTKSRKNTKKVLENSRFKNQEMQEIQENQETLVKKSRRPMRRNTRKR